MPAAVAAVCKQLHLDSCGRLGGGGGSLSLFCMAFPHPHARALRPACGGTRPGRGSAPCLHLLHLSTGTDRLCCRRAACCAPLPCELRRMRPSVRSSASPFSLRPPHGHRWLWHKRSASCARKGGLPAHRALLASERDVDGQRAFLWQAAHDGLQQHGHCVSTRPAVCAQQSARQLIGRLDDWKWLQGRLTALNRAAAGFPGAGFRTQGPANLLDVLRGFRHCRHPAETRRAAPVQGQEARAATQPGAQLHPPPEAARAGQYLPEA